jgi:tRNA threonylcarbamoyladenosine biosynthesis protein TsaB
MSTSSLNILSLDSSTEACSIALLTQNNVIHQRFMLAPREHTQKILPAIHDVLKEADLNLPNIDVIVYGQGPGSFTGVRIGISIAQGLAYGLDKKMVGVSTLQAMAQQALQTAQSESVYAAIDARMGEVYFAHYLNHEGVMVLQDKEVVITPENLVETVKEKQLHKNSLLVGTGWAAYPLLQECFSMCKLSDIIYPNAVNMIDAGKLLIEQNRAVAPEFATPVYLRDTVTWKKLPGRE